MSSKFEQLLDLLVNEEIEKAHELFHEIVVEKSRSIYEGLIAEEGQERYDANGNIDPAGEYDSMGQLAVDDQSVEEETEEEIGGDASDDLVSDVEDDEFGGDGDDEFGSEEDEFGADDEGSDPATKDDVTDLADALEDLKAEFQALLAGEKDEPEHSDMFGSDDEDSKEGETSEFGAEDDSDETADETFMREYREVIGKPYGSGKGVSGTSESEGTNKQSPVSSAKGRPSSTATASNIAQSAKGEDVKGGASGLLKKGGEFVKSATQNVGSTKTSGYSTKVPGHGAEKKGTSEPSVNAKDILPR